MTNRLEANWRTLDTLAIKVACRLGRLKLNAVPTGDFGSAPFPAYGIKSTQSIRSISFVIGNQSTCQDDLKHHQDGHAYVHTMRYTHRPKTYKVQVILKKFLGDPIRLVHFTPERVSGI